MSNPVTHDLIAYLRARVDEDETDALQYAKDYDRWQRETMLHRQQGHACGCQGCITLTFPTGSLSDPARVLAEVAAKRVILDEVLDYVSLLDGDRGCCHSAEEIGRDECECFPVVRIDALRAMVQPYAAHPDFDPAWRTT